MEWSKKSSHATVSLNNAVVVWGRRVKTTEEKKSFAPKGEVNECVGAIVR
jgi:hypothetical protein